MPVAATVLPQSLLFQEPNLGRVAPNLAEQAYQELINRLISLEIQPGSRLQERQLAEALQMSRTPIREALTRLSHEGWVRINARRNIEVKDVNRTVIHEVFEVREMLELRGVERIIADDANHAAFVNLSVVHDAMSNMRADDFAYILTNQKFHAYLSTVDHNSLLYDFWKRVNLENIRLGVMAVRVQNRRKEAVLDEHREIINALIRRDLEAARSALLNHLGTIRANLLAILPQD